MRFRKFRVQPMFLFRFILTLLLIGSGDGRRIPNGRNAAWKGEKYSGPSMGYFSGRSPSPEPDDDDFGDVYGVSKRLVPQGPNPLHN